MRGDWANIDGGSSLLSRLAREPVQHYGRLCRPERVVGLQATFCYLDWAELSFLHLRRHIPPPTVNNLPSTIDVASSSSFSPSADSPTGVGVNNPIATPHESTTPTSATTLTVASFEPHVFTSACNATAPLIAQPSSSHPMVTRSCHDITNPILTKWVFTQHL
ncbi:hypothetical protein L1887_15456 [Cichorium endivia]|nr:hypothetical protein L1887_15456 [Cichorium endivia]